MMEFGFHDEGNEEQYRRISELSEKILELREKEGYTESELFNVLLILLASMLANISRSERRRVLSYLKEISKP